MKLQIKERKSWKGVMKKSKIKLKKEKMQNKEKK